MNFQVVQLLEGREFAPAFNLETKEPLIYDCPKIAAQVATRLTKERGCKFQPRPVSDDAANWREREQKRFDDGKYKPVVWLGQEWFDKHHNKDHFVHVGVKDPTCVAFVSSDKDGMVDIQTPMKPGKYLTKYFAEVLTKEEIRDYAMQHSLEYEVQELRFARTPEEIEKVYAYPLHDSCFSGTKKANCYGSGDWAVAYIADGDAIRARSICVPERKLYIRPYGDTARLKKLLEDAGYKNGGYDREKFKGLRLVKSMMWAGFYSDAGCGTAPHPTDKDYLVTT